MYIYIYCIYTHFRAKQRMSTNFSRHSKCFAFILFSLRLRSILWCMSIRTTIYCEIYIIKECLITWLWNIIRFVRLFFNEAHFLLRFSSFFFRGRNSDEIIFFSSFGRKFFGSVCVRKVFLFEFEDEEEFMLKCYLIELSCMVGQMDLVIVY